MAGGDEHPTGSGQQLERWNMPRYDHREVTSVQGRHLGLGESFAHGDHRSVDEPEPEVGVAFLEFGGRTTSSSTAGSRR